MPLGFEVESHTLRSSQLELSARLADRGETLTALVTSKKSKKATAKYGAKTTISYEFMIAGHKYVEKAVCDCSLLKKKNPGDPIDVAYDPEDPSFNRVLNLPDKSKPVVRRVLFTAFLLGGAGVALWRFRKNA